MLTFNDIREIANSLSCTILNNGFHFILIDKGLEGFLLQVSMFMPDYNHPKQALVEQKSGKYYISPYATKGEVVQKCLLACIQFMEHEVRENFKYKGLRIFGPHISLDALIERATTTEKRS